jgi:hypothetical protein
MKYLKTFIILITFSLKAQEIKLSDSVNISVTLNKSWNKISKVYYNDTFTIDRKQLEKFKTRGLIEISLIQNDKIPENYPKTGCELGHIYKEDTIAISNFQTFVFYAVDCFWFNHDPKNIAAYSIHYLIKLNNEKFIRVFAEYYSEEKKYYNEFEKEILNILESVSVTKT